MVVKMGYDYQTGARYPILPQPWKDVPFSEREKAEEAGTWIKGRQERVWRGAQVQVQAGELSYEQGLTIVNTALAGARGVSAPGPVAVEPISIQGVKTMAYNGYGVITPGEVNGGVVTVGMPAIVGGAALIIVIRALVRRMAVMSVGFFRFLVTRYGAGAVKVALGVTIFTQLWELMSGGAPDDMTVSLPRRRKRYSIGANPRMTTLLKVAKRVDNIFVQYDSRMRKFRSRIKGPVRTRRAPVRYVSPPHR